MPATYFPFRWMVGTFQEILDSSSGNSARIKSMTDLRVLAFVGSTEAKYSPTELNFWDFHFFQALLRRHMADEIVAEKSMARLVLPSRLELKMPEGSSNEAPLAKVIFTTFLYVSPVQIIPVCDHTGTPRHFHSSITSGSACLMRIRTRASVSLRQSRAQFLPHPLDRWRSRPCPPYPRDDYPGSPPPARSRASAPLRQRRCHWLPTPGCLLCSCDSTPTFPIVPARPAARCLVPARWPHRFLPLLPRQNCPGAHRVLLLDLSSCSC